MLSASATEPASIAPAVIHDERAALPIRPPIQPASKVTTAVTASPPYPPTQKPTATASTEAPERR